MFHATSLGAVRQALPPLPIGSTFLERWPIRQPGGTDWRAEHYDSVSPAVFVLRDVLVHGAAGILGIEGDVVDETLAHTDPDRHGYRRREGSIALTAWPQKLAGTHVAVLAGGAENYFHAMIEGVMRLACVPAVLLHGAQGLLHAAGGAGQDAMLRLMGLPGTLAPRAVRTEETLLVETLVLPSSVHGLFSYHPCLSTWFDRMSDRVPGGGASPRRIYLDRHGSPLRRLVDEDAVVAGLEPLGFVPVRPERLSAADQLRLFRSAEMIVAPHGAALTNLGFCRPGCRVLELHMDAYVNWGFRHLAALRGLSYDCVLGRAEGAWTDLSPAVHGLSWRISPQHVAAAARRMLDV